MPGGRSAASSGVASKHRATEPGRESRAGLHSACGGESQPGIDAGPVACALDWSGMERALMDLNRTRSTR
jgi:hypothetical protein